MEQVRSFIAIELPDGLKAALSRLEAQLKANKQQPVKWVDPNSIHLTLKFLGSVASDKMPAISRAMAETAQDIPPFNLEARGLGMFPNPQRVQVVWVGLSGETDKLCRLQQGLEMKLAQIGFAPEKRAFAPHLTLARVRDHASPQERQDIGKLIADASFELTHTIKVEAISLMRSQLTREGAIYSRISAARLSTPLPRTGN